MSKSKAQKKKLKVAIILSILIIMIFGKNVLERRNFNKLSDSFISFYDDRLVVESYIFSISEKLFRIKLLINHCDFESDYSDVVEEISNYEIRILDLVDEFEKTDLTPKEEEFLGDFRRIIENNLRINDYSLLFTEEEGINKTQVIQYNTYIERAVLDLEKLSQIQIDEGKRLATASDRLINKSKIWAQFEIAALLILLIIFYILIYTSKTVKADFVE